VGVFVVRVVVDVLGHVVVHDGECRGIGWISCSAGDFAVLDSAELVVLDPEIGLDDLRRGSEAKHGSISAGEKTTVSE